MRAGTHHTKETKDELRARNRTYYSSRDYNILREERAAELAKKSPRMRPDVRYCISCKKQFHSQWCGNRICNLCKASKDFY